MTEPTEQQPTTLSFNDKEYVFDDLGQEAKMIVANLQDVGIKLGQKRMEVDQLEAARMHFTSLLEQELEKGA